MEVQRGIGFKDVDPKSRIFESEGGNEIPGLLLKSYEKLDGGHNLRSGLKGSHYRRHVYPDGVRKRQQVRGEHRPLRDFWFRGLADNRKYTLEI